jgi:hypothetical protein
MRIGKQGIDRHRLAQTMDCTLNIAKLIKYIAQVVPRQGIAWFDCNRALILAYGLAQAAQRPQHVAAIEMRLRPMRFKRQRLLIPASCIGKSAGLLTGQRILKPVLCRKSAWALRATKFVFGCPAGLHHPNYTKPLNAGARNRPSFVIS